MYHCKAERQVRMKARAGIHDLNPNALLKGIRICRTTGPESACPVSNVVNQNSTQLWLPVMIQIYFTRI